MEKNEYKDKLFDIADAVTMQSVLNQYGIPARREKGRVPCPFHHGKDLNLGYSEHKFSCFVCGARGNPVSFVAKLFNESNNSAARRIDADFGLSIYGKQLTFAEAQAIERRRLARLEAGEQKKKRNGKYKTYCTLLHIVERELKEIHPLPQILFLEDLQTTLEGEIEDLWREMTDEC